VQLIQVVSLSPDRTILPSLKSSVLAVFASVSTGRFAGKPVCVAGGMVEPAAGRIEERVEGKRVTAVSKNRGDIPQAKPIRFIQLSTSMNPEG